MLRRDPVDRRPARIPLFRTLLSSASRFEQLRFISEDSNLAMRNVRVAGSVSAILVLLFSVLDFFVYPQFFHTFLLLRIACSMLIFLFTWLSTKKWARKNYTFICPLVPLTAALFISMMIYLIKEPDTHYYAGLNLCVVATGTLFRGTALGIIVSCFLILGMYIVATIPDLGSLTGLAEKGIYGGNCLFIISTILLIILGAFIHNNFRYSEFVARAKLRNNQTVLEERNQKLKETFDTLRRTEKQLYQSDKMSFLGQLSAGVIHEIGNPLNFSNQALYLLRKRITTKDDPSRTEEIIDDLQDGLDRIRSIISDLREFSHSGDEKGAPFTVAECIYSGLRILRKPIAESGADMVLEIDEKVQVVGIKNQITQVFTNLIHNSVQALQLEKKPGGILRITTDVDEDGMAVIVIRDNGPGIPKDHIDNLFDPFFTTKDPGEGTGLGLSISYRIVEAHSGELQVESEIGHGTTFTILLPCPGLRRVANYP